MKIKQEARLLPDKLLEIKGSIVEAQTSLYMVIGRSKG